MAEDLDPVVDALTKAHIQLRDAVSQLTSGTAASKLSPAQLSRLRALDDTNTGCQNSGCGGGGAERAAQLKTNQ